MADLEEIKERSARLREIERQDAAWQRKPFLVRWFITQWWTLRYLADDWIQRRVDRVRSWWSHDVQLVSRYIHLRESVRDRYLVLCGRPLYFRCFNYLVVFRPCRNDATWTYVGSQTDGSSTPPPHHPIQCDVCMKKESPELPDYMRRVGRWYRAPSYLTVGAACEALTRPAADRYR
jgi:hypothetical protein